MKQEIIELLHSMNEEDIEFGIHLAKAHNLFYEIDEILKREALPVEKWADSHEPNREKQWCWSSWEIKYIDVSNLIVQE